MEVRQTLPDGRIIDVRYEDTVSDPIGTASRVLKAIGLPVDTAALEACIAANARDARPKHKYSAEAFGLSDGSIAADFAFYHDAYNI